MNYNIFLYTIFLIFTICNSNASASESGKTINGRYYSKCGLFSLKEPKMGSGFIIEDSGIINDRYSVVVFSDDFGSLLRVEVLLLADENWIKNDDGTVSTINVEEFFNDCVVRPIKKQFPATTVNIKGEKVSDSKTQSNPIFFATVYIPEGSTVRGNIQNGSDFLNNPSVEPKNFDSEREYAVFLCDKLLVAISSQENPHKTQLKKMTNLKLFGDDDSSTHLQLLKKSCESFLREPQTVIAEKFIPKENCIDLLQGKIIDGRYYSPKNIYSCKAYDFNQGKYISQDALFRDDSIACVAFYDSAQNHIKAMIMILPQDDQNLKTVDLKAFFNEIAYKILENEDGAKDIEIFDEQLTDNQLYYVGLIANLPLSDRKNSVYLPTLPHASVTKYYLTYQEKNKIIILSNHSNLQSNKTTEKQLRDGLKENIFNFKTTFEFDLINKPH